MFAFGRYVTIRRPKVLGVIVDQGHQIAKLPRSVRVADIVVELDVGGQQRENAEVVGNNHQHAPT